jgi:hypothetical protein
MNLDMYIAGTSISDASVPMLSRLRKLDLLGIEETKISAAGRRELRSRLPDCVISSETDDDGNAPTAK